MAYTYYCIVLRQYSVERRGLPNRATGTHRARRKINLDERKKLDWLVTASSAAAGSDMIVCSYEM